MFTSNGKYEFVPHDQVSPLLVAYCSKSFIMHIKYFFQFFLHKNIYCSELFLSAHFLF